MDVLAFKEFGFPAMAFGAMVWLVWQNTAAVRRLAEAVAELRGYLQRMAGNGGR